MNQKTYLLICGTVFLIVALAHLTRLIAGWDIVVAGWVAPNWISVPGLIIPGCLSAWGFMLALRSKTTA
jgi:hypothetical protein